MKEQTVNWCNEEAECEQPKKLSRQINRRMEIQQLVKQEELKLPTTARSKYHKEVSSRIDSRNELTNWEGRRRRENLQVLTKICMALRREGGEISVKKTETLFDSSLFYIYIIHSMERWRHNDDIECCTSSDLRASPSRDRPIVSDCNTDNKWPSPNMTTYDLSNALGLFVSLAALINRCSHFVRT